MIITFIIPAYKASETLGGTLQSIFDAACPAEWTLDVLVADDGSPDTDKQREITSQYDQTRYLSHTTNQGKCAAVNMAVPHSQGDIVIMLDSDDHMISNWPEALARILESWPESAPLCFSACRTHTGQTTVAHPTYTGPMIFDDMLNERYSGEYLPIFRGDDLRRRKGYRDPGMPWGCEMWTYLGVLKEADAWVSAEVLRIYQYNRPGSVTHASKEAHMASQITRCYDLVFSDFEDDYRDRAPLHLSKRKLRQAVYTALSGDKPKAFKLWKQNAGFHLIFESGAALVLILLGRHMTRHFVALGKSVGLIKRFG